MDLFILSLYIPFKPKALITVEGEQLTVTLVGLTEQSVVTDNGAFFPITSCKLYLHDLKDCVNKMVEHDPFGALHILDLISMSRADYERFKYGFEHDNLMFEKLQLWQLKRLAQHYVDFAGLVPKSEALNIKAMHDE